MARATTPGPAAAAMLLAAALAGPSLGCGASIQAVYEGHVRFEHCMALDAEVHVKPTIRRACWAEWVAFYTYGQTRDRVVHAQLRIRQLSGVSEFVAPTSPPPLTPEPPLVDAAIDERLVACTGSCMTEREDCNRDCDTGSCDKSCAVGYRSCVRRCG